MKLIGISFLANLKKLLVILSVVTLFITRFNLAYAPPDTSSKIKAVYLYNFSKYFDWPASYKSGNFVIGILGKAGLHEELITMASSKTVGTQKIEVKSFDNLDDLSRCHMLYIPADQTSQFSKVLAKIKGNSTLIITERDGMAKQGAAINFVIQNNKQKFELNKSNAEKYSLKVSSSLESLAILVN